MPKTASPWDVPPAKKIYLNREPFGPNKNELLGLDSWGTLTGSPLLAASFKAQQEQNALMSQSFSFYQEHLRKYGKSHAQLRGAIAALKQNNQAQRKRIQEQAVYIKLLRNCVYGENP